MSATVGQRSLPCSPDERERERGAIYLSLKCTSTIINIICSSLKSTTYIIVIIVITFVRREADTAQDKGRYIYIYIYMYIMCISLSLYIYIYIYILCVCIYIYIYIHFMSFSITQILHALARLEEQDLATTGGIL